MDPNPQDGRLEEAMRRSPELAAMLAKDRADPLRRFRRLAAVLGALGVAIVVLWLAVRGISRWRSHDEPATEIDNSVYLPPIKTEKAPTGEEIAPFTGFAVSVDTVPQGALVSIAGKVRGEAPVLASVDCKGTEKVAIGVRKEGYRSVRRELQCRADQLVKLTIPLER
ncbi:MAG TPA: PEGA domain-containing protein [Anaeromyxobacter sp.]